MLNKKSSELIRLAKYLDMRYALGVYASTILTHDGQKLIEEAMSSFVNLHKTYLQTHKFHLVIRQVAKAGEPHLDEFVKLADEAFTNLEASSPRVFANAVAKLQTKADEIIAFDALTMENRSSPIKTATNPIALWIDKNISNSKKEVEIIKSSLRGDLKAVQGILLNINNLLSRTGVRRDVDVDISKSEEAYQQKRVRKDLFSLDKKMDEYYYLYAGTLGFPEGIKGLELRRMLADDDSLREMVTSVFNGLSRPIQSRDTHYLREKVEKLTKIINQVREQRGLEPFQFAEPELERPGYTPDAEPIESADNTRDITVSPEFLKTKLKEHAASLGLGEMLHKKIFNETFQFLLSNPESRNILHEMYVFNWSQKNKRNIKNLNEKMRELASALRKIAVPFIEELKRNIDFDQKMVGQ